MKREMDEVSSRFLDLEKEPNTYKVHCSTCGLIAKHLDIIDANKLRVSHNCETFKQTLEHKNIFEK